jgi:hypothetical protein
MLRGLQFDGVGLLNNDVRMALLDALGHATDGAILFCDVPFRPRIDPFEATATAFGFTADDPADIEITSFESKCGTCIAMPEKKDFAFAVGRRLAQRLKRSVRFCTVSIIAADGGQDSDFDCVVEDVTIAINGTTTRGRWEADVTSRYGEDWGSLCDNKVYWAVAGVLGNAIGSVLSDAEEKGSCANRLGARRRRAFGQDFAPSE